MSLLSRLSPPQRLTIDSHAALGGAHARRTGRSWWALRYLDGTVVNEWDSDPGSVNGHMDWPRLAMLGKLRGTQALRLYCPSGRMAELGGEGDQTGRLFQFKVGARHIGVGVGVVGQEVLAHVIGIINGLDGQCTLYAWEPSPAPPAPDPDQFRGLPPGMLSRAYDDWRKAKRAWEATGGGALTGPILDNVYGLKYQNVGQLSADHLGITDGQGR